MKTITAHGQEIIGPLPAHFLHPKAGQGTAIGIATGTLKGDFGPMPVQVCSFARRGSTCWRAGHHLHTHILN